MNWHAFHIAMAAVLFAAALISLVLAAAHWDRRRIRLAYLHILCAFVLSVAGALSIGMAPPR